MTNHSAETSQNLYARIAGIAYLLIIIIALLSTGFIDSDLIVPGNDAETTKNIMAHDSLFRISIALILFMYMTVVILAWALYVLLKSVNKNLALLALLLRSAEAVLGAVTVLISFFVLGLLNGNSQSTVFETEQLQALVGIFLNVRTAGLDFVLVFVGLGGTLFCYLFYQSKYVPRILAGWGIITYVSMFLLGFISMLFPNHPQLIEIVPYALGGLFELIFGFWLLIKGINIRQ
jgi:hypothetical protein